MMKKKYREQALSELFRELQHKDFDIRENAMFQLGLMLERSNQSAQMVDAGDIYEDNLSRELLRMKLDDDEQNQVVDVLSQVVAMQKESRPTAFWAIGKVKPSVGISPLLGLIRATGHQLNTEAAYQACDALKRWLSTGVGEDETVSAQLKLQDPTDIIRRWYDSSDDRLMDAADDVLDLLE